MLNSALRWDDLQYFLAVARAGQLSRAADGLRTSHVTVARHIDRLEGALGVTLFDRRPKGYDLTVEGEKLRDIVEKLEADTTRLPDLLAAASPDVGGTIRVNMPEGMCSFFCRHLLGAFRQQFPRLTLELAAIQQLASYTPNMSDLSVVLDPPKASTYFTEKIVDYGLHVYGSRDYLATHPPVSQRDDFLSHDFISYIDGMVFMPSLDYLFEVAPKLRPALQCSSIFSQMMAVRHGLGLAVLPDFLAAGREDLVPVLKDTVALRRSYWLACRSELRFAPREKAVITALIDSMRAQEPRLLP
ncbi:MAG: LysR family transcriptional regulator [Paracoccus denitrificans]|nr:MAG: LysR family transcriptional regulator [Paracoccus denitrificans]PZO84894.1 MAG: LysR family transcriptional regulator [Paracoccus denitrificans]